MYSLLTAKDKEEEEEEMKRELQDMKLYESWHTYDDMKDILVFVNESKDMANVSNDESNARKETSHTSNKCNPEPMPKSNVSPELEILEENAIPRLIHPHKSNHTLPIIDQIPPQNRDNSELVPSIAESRNYVYRNKNLGNDNAFDRYAPYYSKFPSLTEGNTLQDPHSTNNVVIEIDSNNTTDNTRNLEKWQINPLDSCVSENDVPLREPERPLAQDRMPYKLCKDVEILQSFGKRLAAVNTHLTQTAEFWHSLHRTADSKFQWGSPSQVGVTKNNLDKITLTNDKTEENQMECADSERPNKRKSNLLVSSSETIRCSNDEDDKLIKKKKTQSNEMSNRILRSHKNERISKEISTETSKLETVREARDCVSPELTSYSRIFTPPNIRKSIKKKKQTSSNGDKSAITDSHDKNNMLTDEEIRLELENDDAVNNVAKPSENVEIKPLPVKGLSHRLRNECTILERIQKEKQEKIETEKEEALREEERKRKEKEELYKRQMEEREDFERLKEEREKDLEEKMKKWQSIINKKSLKSTDENKCNKTRGSFRLNQDEMLQESSPSAIKRTDIRENVQNNVNCPICNQSFPSDKIETHAAGCEQYAMDNEDQNNGDSIRDRISLLNVNNEEILECGICLKYRTTNSVNYEQHVNSCLQRQRQEAAFSEYANTGDKSDDDLLRSPIRCFKPISELTDSEIDFKKQFPSSSKTQIHSNKKRKH